MPKLSRLFAAALIAILAGPAPAAVLQDLSVTPDREGLLISFKADGAVTFKASALHKPERILVMVKGATLQGTPLDKSAAWGQGILKRVRLVDKGAEECWAILDLNAAADFTTAVSSGGFDVSIQPKEGEVVPEGPKIKAVKEKTAKPKSKVAVKKEDAGAPEGEAAPVAPLQSLSPTAKVPLVNLMLFDLNVNYQGKHYDRYPCANLIYTPSDVFPLEREFSTVLVFHHGFGAFSGTARVLDPQGHVMALGNESFSFKLYNALGDAMVELPWKVQFSEKGVYKLVLALNGVDVMFHEFYVGHNTDTLPETAETK